MRCLTYESSHPNFTIISARNFQQVIKKRILILLLFSPVDVDAKNLILGNKLFFQLFSHQCFHSQKIVFESYYSFPDLWSFFEIRSLPQKEISNWKQSPNFLNKRIDFNNKDYPNFLYCSPVSLQQVLFGCCTFKLCSIWEKEKTKLIQQSLIWVFKTWKILINFGYWYSFLKLSFFCSLHFDWNPFRNQLQSVLCVIQGFFAWFQKNLRGEKFVYFLIFQLRFHALENFGASYVWNP